MFQLNVLVFLGNISVKLLTEMFLRDLFFNKYLKMQITYKFSFILFIYSAKHTQQKHHWAADTLVKTAFWDKNYQ